MDQSSQNIPHLMLVVTLNIFAYVSGIFIQDSQLWTYLQELSIVLAIILAIKNIFGLKYSHIKRASIYMYNLIFK